MEHIINTPIDSGSGDTLTVAFGKVNDNFDNIELNYPTNTDLSNELSNYVEIGQEIPISQVSGLETALTNKVDVSSYNNDLLTISNDIIDINIQINDLNTEIDNLSFPDTYVTGGTYSSGTTIFTNNTGGTFSVSGYSTGGTSAYWYAENSTPPTVAPIASGLNSIALGEGAEALSQGMFVYGTNAGTGATNSYFANFIGKQAGAGATNANQSNFFGFRAGENATNSYDSNFLGYDSGRNATNASNSNFIGLGAGLGAVDSSVANFIGRQAGYGALLASNSNFIGNTAGYEAHYANNSQFIGSGAGDSATNAQYSIFIGRDAGYSAIDSYWSNFIGNNAGYGQLNASYSTLIGYNVGSSHNNDNELGTNNIIIGTNISLPNGATNSVNIGGILFGVNSYMNSGNTTPSIEPTIDGRIGIGIVNPEATLHISGDTIMNGNLYIDSLSATTYYNLPQDIYTTGLTFNSSNYDLTISLNDGNDYTQNLGILSSDVNITGGTYNNSTGTATFTNNTGGTFNVTGFITGFTDIYVTGGTFSNKTLTLRRNDNNDVTITGFNDVFVTGGTYSNGTTIFTNNTGGTFSVTGYSTGGTSSGDIYTTGFTYNNANRFTLTSNSGTTLTADINTMTGLTINGGLTATTISGGTLYGDGSNLTGIAVAATEFVVNCRNQSGADMYRGQVIYISGSTGNKPTIRLAQANSEGSSSRTFGVLKNDIPNNSDGDVVTIGSITNLDTRTTATHPFTNDTLNNGDTVYLSPTTPGFITNVKPSAPNHLVYVGKVIRTSPTNGYIEYQIMNGFELDELHDVRITGKTNGDLIVYNSGTTLWENGKTLTGDYVIDGSISATTYHNLPQDVYVTGGTYNSGTGVANFVNNTGGTFNVTGFNTGGGGGGLTLTQVTGLTVSGTGWTLVSGFYEYDLSDANITSSSVVDVIPDNASTFIVNNAGILPRTDSSTGSVKLYSTFNPSQDITITINIFK